MVCSVPTWPEVVRFTLMDSCGRPIYGPTSTFVTDSFSQVEIASNIEEGETFELPKANGGMCCSKPRPDKITFDTWTFDMCAIDTELWSSLNDTFDIKHDYAGNVIGYSESYELGSNNSAFAELFVNTCTADEDLCENPDFIAAEGSWEWIGGGRLINFRGGDTQTYSADANPTQLVAKSQKGNAWGRGPYDVLYDNAGNPAPWAEAIGSQALKTRLATTLAPPKPRCGPIPLSNPAGPKFRLTCTGDDNGRTIRLDLTNDVISAATYLVDWGDGTGAQVINGTMEHTYDAGFVALNPATFVSVWNIAANQMYTATEIMLPCTAPSISVQPLSGTAPMAVAANVDGCMDESNISVDWTNTTAGV